MSHNARRLAAACLILIAGCQGPRVEALTATGGGGGDDGSNGNTESSVDAGACAALLASAKAGDPCDSFEGACTVERGCVADVVRCVGGVLFFSVADRCAPCADDLACAVGSLCLDGLCTECPIPTACPACPEGQAPLARNGCQTCTCAPPTACTESSCAPDLTCVRGAICVDDCQRLDCCANVCTLPGCSEPAPLGCTFDCNDPSCEGTCLAETCECNGETWSCSGPCAVKSESRCTF